MFLSHTDVLSLSFSLSSLPNKILKEKNPQISFYVYKRILHKLITSIIMVNKEMAMAKSQPLTYRHQPKNSGEPLMLTGIPFTWEV